MAEHIDLTTSTKLPKSTKYRASIQADSEEYTAGRLNKESGVLDSNTTIYASPATSSVAHLVLKQYNHQYIQVTTYNRAGEVDEVLKKKEVVTLKINSQYSVDLVGEEGYTKSVLKNIDNKKHKIFKNKYIYAKEEAVPKTCTIKIPKTTNQIISFVSTHGVYSSSTTADKTYTVPYDTEYFVEAKSTKPGYIPGAIKDHDANKPYTIHSGSPCFDLSTLTLTLTVSPVSQKKVKLYIPSYAHQKVSVTVGANTYTSVNSPVEVPYGSSYTSKLEVDKGYVPGRLRPVLNYNTPQADSTEKLNGIAYGDIQFYASDEVKIDSGILLTDFLDGDKKTERFCDWYTHYHELDETQPQIMIDLAHPHKDEPLYTQLSLTPNAKATNFRHFNLKPEEFEWFFLNHLDEENKITHCVVHIIQSPNQTITVEYKGMKTTKSIVVPKGSKIKVTLTLTDSDKYIKGTLNVPENTEITVDHTITLQATPVKLAKCKVVVPEYPNQKLVVTYNGKKYYTDFIVKNGDTITVEVVSTNEHYNPGHVPQPTIIVTDITILSATAATSKNYQITLQAKPHQKIEYVINGNTYSVNKTIPYNSTITSIKVVPEDGYTIDNSNNYTVTGGFTKTDSGWVITGDVNIQSTAVADIKKFKFSIVPSDHQTINVTYYYNGVLRQITNGSAYTAYNSPIWVEISADTGFNAGSIIPVPEMMLETGNKYNLIGDCMIRATKATRKKYHITLVHAPHDHVVCRVNNNTILGTSFDAYYRDHIDYFYSADTGYTTNTVNIAGIYDLIESGRFYVTGDVTLTASANELKKYVISVPQYQHQTVKVVYKGITYNSGQSVTVTHGDTISASVTADAGYTAGNIYFDGDVIDHVDGTYTIKSDCSLYVTDAAPIMRHITIVQQPHETITVVYLGNYYTDSLDVPDGAIVLIPIRADEGYDPGNLNITGSAVQKPGHQPLFSVHSDLTVTAASATVHQYRFKIDTTEKDTIYKHQGIKFLHGEDLVHILTDVVPADGSIHYFNIPRMTLVRVDLVPDAHYVAGKVSYSGPHSDGPGGFKFSGGDMECIVTPATLEKERITLINTDADKQFIKITDKNGVVYTDNFDIEYQEVIYISVVPKDKKIWAAGKYKITGSYTEVTIAGKKAYKITGPCTVTSDPATKRKYKLEAELQPHNKLYVNINGNGTSSDIYTEITTLYPNDIYYDDIIRYKLSTDDPNNYSPGDATVSGAHKNANNTYTVRDNVKIKVSAVVLAKTIIIKKLNSFQGILTVQYTKPDGTLAVETMNSIGSTEETNCKITSNGKIFVVISPKDERYKKPDNISNDWIEATPSIPMQWIPVNNRSVQITASANSEVVFKKLKDISVDLSGWAYDNIPNYANATTIPADKLAYLNSGLLVSNMKMMFAANPLSDPTGSRNTKLTSIPKLNIDTKYVESLEYFASHCEYLTSINMEWLKNFPSAYSIKAMFEDCHNMENIDLSKMITSNNLISINNLFSHCRNLKSTKFSSSLDTSNVANAWSMYAFCENIQSVDLSMLNLSNVYNIQNFFQECNKLKTIKLPSNFGKGNNIPKNISNFFSRCWLLEDDQIQRVISILNNQPIEQIYHMFYECKLLVNIDLSQMNLQSVDTLHSLFENCDKLKTIKLPPFGLNSSVSLLNTFNGCESLINITLPSSILNNTVKVNNLYNTFMDCTNLPNLVINNIVKKMNVSECTMLIYSFTRCMQLTEIDFPGWDTSNVTSMYDTFANCSNLKRINVLNWNVSNVTNMYSVFIYCDKLKSIDLSTWVLNNTSLTGIISMFYYCENLEVVDISKFDTITKPKQTDGIFDRCDNLKYIILDNPQMKFKFSYPQTLPATCKILVPSALIPTYKSTQYWSEHASKIEPMEYYTITRPGDGTVSVQSKIKGYCKFINNHGETIGRIAFDKNGTLLLSSPIPSVTDAPAGKHFFGWTFNNATDYTPAQVQAPGFFMIMINNGVLETSLYAVYRT